jgi:putative phosphoesterase
MRIVLLSDIHGNYAALKAVLQDVEQLMPHADQLVVLGDLVFKGAQPAECVRTVRELECPVVQGNIDELVGKNWIQPGFARDERHAELLQEELDWTRAQLSDEELRYLANLPLMQEIDVGGATIRFVHATPQNVLDVMLPIAPDEAWTRMFEGESEVKMVAYGHIHLPFVRWFDGKVVVNPGSIGLPFDGDWRASYAVVDVQGGAIQSIQHRRVRYDLEAAIQAYEGTGHPQAASVIEAIRAGARPK